MPQARTQTSLAQAGSTGPDWREIGPADPETGQRVSSGCRRKSGGRRMANGGKRADDEYGVSLSGCIAGNSSEPMAQEYPDGPDEEDQEPKKAPNKANLESTQSSSPQKVESGLTGPAGRKRSQSRDDTEIQHREERPAAFRKKHAASATRHYMCHPEESQKILSSSI